MEGISNFLESDAFLPIIIIVLVILIILAMIIVIKNKKDDKIRKATLKVYQVDNNMNMSVYEENPDTEIKIIQDPNPVVVPQVPSASVASAVVQEDLPLVDIPIPDVTDTPIDIEASPVIIQDDIKPTDTQIKIEEEPPVVESPVEQDEIVNIDTNIEVPEETNTTVAFNSEATAVTDIQDEVAVDLTPKEYTGEKTEIFDFPDFTGLNGIDSKEIAVQDLEKGKEIEDDILKAADSFINSIMSK